MSHRIEEKKARRAERLALEESAKHADARRRRMVRAGYGGVGLIAAVLITLALTLGGGEPAATPVASDDSSSSAEIGAKAPDFTLTNAVNDEQVTLGSLAGDKTLLFFSEGVNCQACMIQAADLEKSAALRKAGIRLVSISTDGVSELASAADQYGIETPLLADTSTEMSAAYGMIAHGGMGHPGQDGHAFILLDADGKVLWHQAYQEMYVETKQLMTDMRKPT